MDNLKEKFEEKREKIFRIISKDYEYKQEGLSNSEMENVEKEIHREVEKSLLNGRVDLFYTTTDEGLDFQTVYNLKDEKLEVYIGNELKEFCNLKLDEMANISSNAPEEFHQEYTKQRFSYDSELEIDEINNIQEKDIASNQEVDLWAKRMEEFKDRNLENKIIEEN